MKLIFKHCSNGLWYAKQRNFISAQFFSLEMDYVYMIVVRKKFGKVK